MLAVSISPQSLFTVQIHQPSGWNRMVAAVAVNRICGAFTILKPQAERYLLHGLINTSSFTMSVCAKQPPLHDQFQTMDKLAKKNT
jgi:hypothetical protein